MSNNDGNQNPQSAKVVKLGLNISVTGDPDADFEIVLDDKEQKPFQSSSPKQKEQLQCFDVLQLEGFPATDAPKDELEKSKTQEVTHSQSTGALRKHGKSLTERQSLDPGKMGSGSESGENSSPQEDSIMKRIKSTMEHFEKFSDHIKDIPRLRNRPLATSTPFSEKYNSKSESNLTQSVEHRPRRFYQDFHCRRDYFKSSVRPSPPDLFLKPLPGEDYYYKRGIYTRFLDFEPFRHYGSDISLNKTSVYGGKHEVEKYEGLGLLSEPPSGILKKSDSESGDRQSTSSADSVKDIKIYQSGGILIMQNFKENMDATEKKEMSELSAKLIENCNKLKMEASGWPEESKSSGKMVQFDLSSIDGLKSKSGDSSFAPAKEESSGRLESSESTSDCVKNKDASPQGTSQSQDLTSLSTQENDSFMSNPPGMSPTCASAKKLEWDSGADVGYLNLDLTKENLSTIEKIVLKGLSSDGLSEENIVYERKSRPSSRSRSKSTLERMDAREGTAKSGEDNCWGKDTKPVDEESKSWGGSPGAEDEGKRTWERSSSRENCIGEGKSTFEREESKPESKTPPEEISAVGHTQSVDKRLELTDKSVNVNTLFENLDWQIPPPRRSVPEESHPRPTQRKHSPKTRVPKTKGRPSSQRLTRTPKKPTQSKAALVTSYFDMGNPKKVYKKVEASPVLNEAELSREVEEIIIDQRFKIKNVPSGREPPKEPEIPTKEKPDSGKDAKTKTRPISASSSSNNTVLPKSTREIVEEGKKTKKSPSAFTDQIIQTSDYDRESVGVQAFASQVSSDCDLKSFGKKAKKQKTKTERESVNTSSKNIQAFGLNSSLPKQLEHPVGTEVADNQNTKSTQFFGGALNSLPNYHSNLVVKPLETCGRELNVLKMKKHSDKIRVKAENEKNILANDAGKPIGESEGLNNENKENLIGQKSSNSKRSGSSASGKNGSESEKRENERAKRKTKPGSVEGSDGVSSLVLTSVALKEHGDSIDRNIIQEKYFQSQLAELENREMISRSTSMEGRLLVESVTSGKEYVTTGCQYSPQSRGTTSGGQELEDGSYKGNSNGKTRKKRLAEPYVLAECESPNAGEEDFRKIVTQEQNLDSLPSSTQTAHSWVPGMQHSRENSNGVGKARSFEYLPGHIYESSGNLREELPSETEQNLVTSCCSSDSDTARGGTASNGGAGDSEGRHTLILENSTDESDDRMKTLDRVVEQLNSTVLKLWEKDGEVQSVTRSLLAGLCVKSGSGDWLPIAGADKTEAGASLTDNVGVVATIPKLTSKDPNENEYSIGCQTEEKQSPASDPEKFYEERKALEKRISEEKKCQIKWIENEIHHLNVLRELLERQNSSSDRKKKRSVLSAAASNDTSKSEENYKKKICPRPVTPVYGCTISLSENLPPECSRPSSEQSRDRDGCPPQYGVAVSLSGCSKNWRRVVMLPVGVQVSLKDANSTENCNGERDLFRNHRNSVNGEEKALMQREQYNAQTQYPSTRRPPNLPCTSVQTDLPSSARSTTKDNCFCLNLSEKSYSSSKSKTFERRGSSKLNFPNGECSNGNKTSNSTDPEFLELENDPISDKIMTKSTNDPSDLTESYAKSKSVQSANYKCQNCSKGASWTVGKPCQVKYGKSEEFGTCRCSKIQVQKSSNCTCHIIKIHGSRCCSPDVNSCTCRRGNVEKKTENQSCQTDSGPMVAKELIEYPEIVTATEGPQVKNAYEMKVAYEKRKLVAEKLASEPKVSYEVVQPSRENGSSESGEAVPVASGCSCRKKAEKQKAKADDHPRHYFLRIEEAEMDDSSEPIEEKKSLEVVTVTVPVKRAGRSKIYSNNIRQTRDAENVKGLEVPSKGCNCCAECVQHRRKTQDYDPSGYRRTRAEKPESPTRPVISPECNSYEDVSFYSNQPLKEYTRQEYYPDRSVPQPGFSSSEKPRNGNHDSQCCDGCSCPNRRTPPSREVQMEYDSHKKRRGGNGRFYEDSRGRLAWSSESGRSLGKGVSNQPESDRYNPEFYNYNKREFMTKSELLKEEEEKRKVHQPSLQECLSSNRPDFYSSAERRRQIITERTKERVQRHNNRMDCLMKMIQRCNQNEQPPESKRMFTTVQMREQTMRRYRKLPEVTGKIADERKREEYRTNRLMADIFAKKLQIEALKGDIFEEMKHYTVTCSEAMSAASTLIRCCEEQELHVNNVFILKDIQGKAMTHCMRQKKQTTITDSFYA